MPYCSFTKVCVREFSFFSLFRSVSVYIGSKSKGNRWQIDLRVKEKLFQHILKRLVHV